MKPVVSLAALAWVMAAGAGSAQVVTSIVADTAPGLATGSVASRAGNVTTISGGARAGANLFHSFQQFSLGSNDVARWTAADPASIANVINRVTGGKTSFISGKLDSTALPGAAFWFVNPAGIVFGSTAQVAVPNAAYFASASSIGFSNGQSFSTTTAEGSTFSVANPVSFGFLGKESPITLGAVKPAFIGDANALTLAAPTIGIDASSFNAGALYLLAAGSSEAGVLAADARSAPADAAGRVTIARSTITTKPTSQRDGSLTIAAGVVDIAGGSVLTLATGSRAAGAVTIRAADAIIRSVVGSRTTLAQDAGAVSFSGRNLTVRDGGSLQSSTAGSGNAGSVTVAASGSTIIGAGGEIAARSTPTATTGGAGSVVIDTGSLTLENDVAGSVRPPQISSSTQSKGDGGSVLIRVRGPMSVGRGAFITTSAGSQSRDADAGTLQVNAGSLTITGGQIRSTTLSTGSAGNVAIEVAGPVLLDAALITSASQHADGGAGGGVSLTAGSLVMRNVAQVTSTTASSRSAGTVSVTAGGDMDIGRGSIVSSATTSSGNAGSVRLQAANILLTGASDVDSTTTGAGSAGIVALTTPGRLSVNASSVSASSLTATSGAAGSVVLKVGALDVTRSGQIASSTFSSNPAGTIQAEIAGTASLSSGGTITSSTSGAGAAGSITIKADELKSTGGMVESSTHGAGNGGRVTVSANSINIRSGAVLRSVTDAAGNAGDVAVSTTGALVIGAGGEIAARSTPEATSGGAGSVSITAGTLTLEDDISGSVRPPQISSSTQSRGDGGTVTVDVRGAMTVGRGAFVTTNAGSQSRGARAGTLRVHAGSLDVVGGQIRSATASNGNAGSVFLTIDGPFSVSRGGRITTSSSDTGDAGSIDVGAASVRLDNGGISSSATGARQGRSGSVTIRTDSLQVVNGGAVETSASNPDPAGSIMVAGGSIGVDGLNSRISSTNISTAGGPAGSISLTGNPIRLSNGGSVTTDSRSGAAGDITLTLPPDGFLFLEGAVRPGVITTSSGPGTGGRITIANPYAIITNGGQILALGQQGGANVRIRSNFFIRSADRQNLLSVAGSLVLDSQLDNVASGTVTTDVSYIDASGVLRGQCPAPSADSGVSQFNARGAGPYQDDMEPDPGGAVDGTAIALVTRPGSCL